MHSKRRNPPARLALTLALLAATNAGAGVKTHGACMTRRCCKKHPKATGPRWLGCIGGGSLEGGRSVRDRFAGSTRDGDASMGSSYRNTSDFEAVISRRHDPAWIRNVVHQQSKLGEASAVMRDAIGRIDAGRQQQVREQMLDAMASGTAGMGHAIFDGAPVLCIGARLGGEVRAFKSLGALAVGVDLNPGPLNMDVVAGDMEDLPFPAKAFAFVYMNVLDHVARLDLLAAEVGRVLRPGGLFLAAVLGGGSTDAFSPDEAVTTSPKDLRRLVKTMAKHGSLQQVASTTTEYTIQDMGHSGKTGKRNRPWRHTIRTLYLRRVENATVVFDEGGRKQTSHQ